MVWGWGGSSRLWEATKGIMRRAGILGGLFAAVMVTAALIGVFFFGWRVAGLPFVPFDIFDWVTRVLPGRVIAFGIGTMVSVIRGLNLGPTSETAKMAEQGMAITGFLGAGIAGGLILFGTIRAARGRGGFAVGAACGIALGILAMLVSLRRSPTSSLTPAVRAVWVLGTCLVWGVALGRASQRLPGFRVPGGSAIGGAEAGTDAAAERIDRRRFLVRLGGSTAAITLTGAVVGELAEGRRREAMLLAGGGGPWSATHPLPNANAAVKPAPGTRPEFTPLERHYRIDINTTPVVIEEAGWRLKVGGLVEKPLALTLEELRRYEPLHQFVTLSCISNPVGGDLIGTTRWTGVSLQRLLPALGLKSNGSHLKIRAADEFFEIVPVETIQADERVMLAYAWDGLPLTRDHGFPLRIY